MKERLKIGDVRHGMRVKRVVRESPLPGERMLAVECTGCGRERTYTERYICNRCGDMCASCSMRSATSAPIEIGARYGQWIVKERVARFGDQTRWRCRCSCGRGERNFRASELYGAEKGISGRCRECYLDDLRAGVGLPTGRNSKGCTNIPNEQENAREVPKNASERVSESTEAVNDRYEGFGMPKKQVKEDTRGFKRVRCDVFTREGFLNEHPGAKGLKEWMKAHPKKRYNTDDWIGFVRDMDEERMAKREKGR